MDGNDTSAQAINQCATWMIDHIEARPPILPGGLRGLQDIRSYFHVPPGSISRHQSLSRRPIIPAVPSGPPERSSRSMPIVPPWVSSFQGSLTPIQTRSRDRRLTGSRY